MVLSSLSCCITFCCMYHILYHYTLKPKTNQQHVSATCPGHNSVCKRNKEMGHCTSVWLTQHHCHWLQNHSICWHQTSHWIGPMYSACCTKSSATSVWGLRSVSNALLPSCPSGPGTHSSAGDCGEGRGRSFVGTFILEHSCSSHACSNAHGHYPHAPVERDRERVGYTNHSISHHQVLRNNLP